jgi:hypothetical protein
MYNHIHQPGALISIDMGVYSHIGLVTDRWVKGKPTIIALSETHDSVVELPWHEVVDRRTVKLYPEQGALAPSLVINRARACLGKLQWRVSFNCEHFARAIHGLEIKSIELRKILVGICLVVGAIFTLSQVMKKT